MAGTYVYDGQPLALGERGLSLFQRQASVLNCPLDWRVGLSIIVEGDYVSHDIRCKPKHF